MTDGTAERLLHDFVSSTSTDVTMSLLRSLDAPLHMALMAAHLGDGQLAEGQSLSAAIDADLPGLLRVYRPADEPDDGGDESSEAGFDAYNLYVALTRARKTITIIGNPPSTTLTATKGAHHEQPPGQASRRG